MLGTGVRMQLMMIRMDRHRPRYESYRSRFPETWRVFEERLDLSWLYHDFAMEGVSLTETDTQSALARTPPRHYAEDQTFEHIRELMGAIVATRSMATHHRGPLELEDLKSFHVFLAGDSDPAAGRYRKDDSPPCAYQHIVTRPPSISYRLRKLLEAMQGPYREMHPVQAAAHIHHDFMTTWPFDDRSGTAGRLLMNYWLLAAGFPPAIFHATDRQAYYDALCQGPPQLADLIMDALTTALRSADTFFEKEAGRPHELGTVAAVFGLLG
jgi:Fic family protein